MNTDFFKKNTSLSLLLLWIAYSFLGWYLSAHHIIWLLGLFIAIVPLFVGSKNSSLFERLLSFLSSRLFVGFTIFLIVSILLFSLAVTKSILLPLTIIPLATTVLAELEMRLTGFNKLNTFVILTIIAGFGLVVGEMIDIMLLESSRY